MTPQCRLCLGENVNNKKNIFCTKLSRCKEPLVNILYWTFAIEVDAADPYPKEVCRECLVLIEYVLEIKNTFKRNEDVLKKSHDPSIKGKNIQNPPSGNLEQVQALYEFDISNDEKVETVPEEVNKPFLNIEKDYEIQIENALLNNESTSLQNIQNNESFTLDLPENSEKNCLKTVKRTPSHALQKFEKSTEKKMLKSFPKNTNTNSNQSIHVLLEPVEYLMSRERYKKINTFVYVKNTGLNEPENSCDSNINSFFKVSNVPNLYVCNLCSESFLNRTALNLHYKRRHELTHHKQPSKVVFKNLKFAKKKQDSDSDSLNNNSFSNHSNSNNNEVSFDNKEKVSWLRDHIRVFSLGLRRTTMLDYNQSQRKRHKPPIELHNCREKRSVMRSSTSAALNPKLKYAWKKQRLGTYSAMKYRLDGNDTNDSDETKNADDTRAQRLDVPITNLKIG